jgi:glycosyltransferase involved in cell wall biosynthesis
MENKEMPLVSVIIPTYNSEKTIGRCLESIKNQTYKNVEIIVVDNFSEDKTVEICKEYNASIIKVKGERTKAKNIGLKNANGKYVLFVDSDMELTPNVIEECVMLCESNSEIGGVVIPERSVGDSYWVKVRDFERSFYAGTEIESARFFRRDLALQAGGFDEEVVFFEESTLPQKIEKLGYSVGARVSSYILHHEEGFSLRKWLKKKYYYGKTAKNYRTKYKEYGNKQISLFYRFGLFFKSRRFWSKPHLAIGIIVLKGLEYLVVGIGYIDGE